MSQMKTMGGRWGDKQQDNVVVCKFLGSFFFFFGKILLALNFSEINYNNCLCKLNVI